MRAGIGRKVKRVIPGTDLPPNLGAGLTHTFNQGKASSRLLTMDGLTAVNPFRSPSWRCARVMKLLRLELPPRRFDGYPIRAYRRFILNCNAAGNDEQQLEVAYEDLPHVASAHSLHYSPEIEAQQILEARLLTGETFEVISSRLGLETQAVELYEQLFFDVRSRLRARDVINKFILDSRGARSFCKDGTMTVEQRGFLYRLFAYYDGPLVLDAMITSIGNLAAPTDPRDVGQWFDNALRAIVQTRSTAAARLFEINKQNMMQLLKLAMPTRPKTKVQGEDASNPEALNRRMFTVLTALEQAIVNNSVDGVSAHPTAHHTI
jgi:hypothetical protein